MLILRLRSHKDILLIDHLHLELQYYSTKVKLFFTVMVCLTNSK